MLIDAVYTRVCKICKNEFETQWPKSNHCSKECRKVSTKLQQRAKYFRKKAREAPNDILRNRYIKQSEMGTKAYCNYCNGIFDTFGKNTQYCSAECRANAKRRSKGTETHKICRECGELFDLQGQGGYKYCPVCRGEATKINKKIKNKTVKELIEEHETSTEEEITINPYFLKRGNKSTGTGNDNIMSNY